VLAYFLLCQACQPVSSGIPTKVKFQVSLLSRVGGWVVGGWLGGWGEIEIKAKLSPAEAGVWQYMPCVINMHFLKVEMKLKFCFINL
jgi:hypothetical protein